MILTVKIKDKIYISKKITDSINRLQDIKYVYMKKDIKIDQIKE
jgi:hypothetical protein